MSVDNETVRKVAFLARLKVEPEKLEEKLGEVNTDNVEPLVSVNDEALTLRQDNITAGQMSEQILKNAPAQEFGYFVVPKVVE